MEIWIILELHVWWEDIFPLSSVTHELVRWQNSMEYGIIKASKETMYRELHWATETRCDDGSVKVHQRRYLLKITGEHKSVNRRFKWKKFSKKNQRLEFKQMMEQLGNEMSSYRLGFLLGNLRRQEGLKICCKIAPLSKHFCGVFILASKITIR